MKSSSGPTCDRSPMKSIQTLKDSRHLRGPRRVRYLLVRDFHARFPFAGGAAGSGASGS